MFVDKKITFKFLLESVGGPHISCYIKNNGNLSDIVIQLDECIHTAKENLESELSTDELNSLLDPLIKLKIDSSLLNNIDGNIGLFRNKNVFRILKIPIPLKRQTHIATSFHIKPLLKWVQEDREFIFIGLDIDKIHVYYGNKFSNYKINTLQVPKLFKNKVSFKDYLNITKFKSLRKEKIELFESLNQWLNLQTSLCSPKLFIAGSRLELQDAFKYIRYNNINKEYFHGTFYEEDINEIYFKIRSQLTKENFKMIDEALTEYEFAEENRLASRNFFRISKAAIQGKVKKLIIAEDASVYGKIDPKTGELILHPYDLNHEDDDVLDDLAQTVLNQGGEVVVASKNIIPKGRPLLAIFKNEIKERPIELQKIHAV